MNAEQLRITKLQAVCMSQVARIVITDEQKELYVNRRLGISDPNISPEDFFSLKSCSDQDVFKSILTSEQILIFEKNHLKTPIKSKS